MVRTELKKGIIIGTRIAYIQWPLDGLDLLRASPERCALGANKGVVEPLRLSEWERVRLGRIRG